MKKFFACMVVGVFCSVFCLTSQTAIAKTPSIVPETAVAITNIKVDTFSETISIKGLALDDQDLDRLVVTLGDMGEVPISAVYPDGEIMIDCP